MHERYDSPSGEPSPVDSGHFGGGEICGQRHPVYLSHPSIYLFRLPSEAFQQRSVQLRRDPITSNLIARYPFVVR